MNADGQKRAAAEQAAALVESGMALGLGSGTTATYFLEALARRQSEGSLREIVGVPTSERTAEVAQRLGLALTSLNDLAPRWLDLAVDGADEVAPDLTVIKGLGGALLREKIVAAAAKRFVVIVDESKLVARLGTRSPVPVEVVPFGWRALLPHFEALGGRPELRQAKGSPEPLVTDQGNYIVDCHFEGIDDPAELNRRLRSRAGVAETGIFVGLVTEVLVAGEAGIRMLTRAESSFGVVQSASTQAQSASSDAG